MITQTEKIRQTPMWQKELALCINNIDELLSIIELDASQLEISKTAEKQFSIKIPAGYVYRIKKSDPQDPLLRQILPVMDETIVTCGYVNDPVNDPASMVAQGLLKKYNGRALLLATAACAIHCRYCFRRHFPYADATARADWLDTLEYLRRHADIHELILSGGDPLTLSDTRLSGLVEKIAAIPHITTLRIHSRLPVVLPERVCEELLMWVQKTRLKVVFVIHCNHAQEIDSLVGQALQSLAESGVTLLNQSVLLKGVNDSADALVFLSQKLFKYGVLPYYLHTLDPVAGAAHFDVDDNSARRLVSDMQARLPGYLIPRLVREMTGKPSKIPVI